MSTNKRLIVGQGQISGYFYFFSSTGTFRHPVFHYPEKLTTPEFLRSLGNERKQKMKLSDGQIDSKIILYAQLVPLVFSLVFSVVKNT